MADTENPNGCTPELNPREVLLAKASNLVNGPRNKDYDEPIDNFQRIADFWNAYLVGIGDRDLEPHDVALLNILQKIARLQHSTDHADSWVDIAGYAACGWDTIVTKSLAEPEVTATLYEFPTAVEEEPTFEYKDDVVAAISRQYKYRVSAMFCEDSPSAVQALSLWLFDRNQPLSFDLIEAGNWYIVGPSGLVVMNPQNFTANYEVVLPPTEAT